uniref:KA1 domain-containing protein n=1 Tax=Anopheles farauti TaxID=69004 RepID=A0A182QUK2_9DIPT
MHCKAFVTTSAATTTVVDDGRAMAYQDITVPHDVLLSLVPGLEKLVQENRLQIETAKTILNTRTMPYEVGHQLGLVRGGVGGGAGVGMLDVGMNLLQLQHSQSVSPLSSTLRHGGGASTGGIGGYPATARPTGFTIGGGGGGGMQPSYMAGGAFGAAFGNHHPYAGGFPASAVSASSTGMCHLSGLDYPGSNSNSGCPSPVYYSTATSGCSSPILPGPPPSALTLPGSTASIVSGCSGNIGASSGAAGAGVGAAPGAGGSSSGGAASPMHQITRGISTLNTGGSGASVAGGSITRGTSGSAATTPTFPPSVACNEPLDLSMDIVNSVEIDFTGRISMAGCYSSSGATTPVNYFGGLLPPPPPQTMRICATPPTSPNNLCIIQEEHSATAAPFKSHSANASPEDLSFQIHTTHPQICLTDVQGSEITLVALSDSSHGDSDDSLNCCHTTGGGSSSATTSGLGFSGLLITEPSSDMPSITRGVGRKASLDTENNSSATTASSAKLDTSDLSESYVRRGSDKSLGFSDDSLSNDSNHSALSPGQEPATTVSMASSSGFKSADSNSSEQDGAARLSPDSLCDGAKGDECYELPLPQECSSLDSARILELVKRTLDSTMPPKGCVVYGHGSKRGNAGAAGETDHPNAQLDGGGASFSNSERPGQLHQQQQQQQQAASNTATCSSSRTGTGPDAGSNLSLEFSGGLQIELQVYEGRNSKDNSNTGSKGIKLRRISGDQYEYGKLCQQLITSLTV